MSQLLVVVFNIATIFIIGIDIKIKTGVWIRNFTRLKHVFISVLVEGNKLDFKTKLSRL